MKDLSSAVVEIRRRLAMNLGAAQHSWYETAPDLIADLAKEWNLTVSGEEIWAGYGGIAVPVTQQDRTAAVLKVTYSENKRDLENEILAAWSGKHAVALLARDDTRHARLLTRLPGPTLFETKDARAAMTATGTLAADLAIAPPSGLPSIAESASLIAERLARSARPARVGKRDLDVAISTYRHLGSEQPNTLLHGDLQGRNVMLDARGDWTVIDPLGIVGEPALEALTVLRDRWRSLPDEPSPHNAIYGQLQAFAEASRSPLERVVAWTQARSVRAAVAGVDDDDMHIWIAAQLRPPYAK